MKLLSSAFRTPLLVTLILMGIVVQLTSPSTALALEDAITSSNDADIIFPEETATNENLLQEDVEADKAALENTDIAGLPDESASPDDRSDDDELPIIEPLTIDCTQSDTTEAQLEIAGKEAVLGLMESVEPDVRSTVSEDYSSTHCNIYRLYNPNSGEHLFTYDFNEAKTLASIGWRWEDVAWVAPNMDESIYRLYNPNSGDHHYTTDRNEYDTLSEIGWIGEGVGWYSDSNKKVPLYRLFNPNEQVGTHHYTASAEERDFLSSIGWKYEGIGWYATDGEPIAIEAQWLISPSWGSLERYWINTNGSIARNRFILPEEGAGYLAYAKSNGAVVRGKWDNGAGYVYVADNAGKLASTSDGKTGWLVTADYDEGLERYYYDADKHAMRTGLFTIDGKQYYGMGGTGRIARNNVVSANGKTYYADNDGVLTETHSEHDITLARALAELAICTNSSMSNEQKLRAAFNHIRDDFREYNPRIPHMKQLGWETIYANDMFVGRGGNCCSYGAAFAFMAKAIGYSNVYCCNSGGHGWAEVDGRVYDPEWERANPGRSYYSIGYNDNSGVNYKVVLNNSDWMRVAI